MIDVSTFCIHTSYIRTRGQVKGKGEGRFFFAGRYLRVNSQKANMYVGVGNLVWAVELIGS